MSSTILFVFEGERPETNITKGLSKHFVNEYTSVECVFDAEIYQLYKKLKSDPYLDTFELLKTRRNNQHILRDFNRRDFAEIYLFFDYDGHATNANDNTISELLDFFDQETEAGKLYISYPMAEAIRHIGENVDFQNLTVLAKEKINYKRKVGDEGASDLQNLRSLPLTSWIFIIEAHLKKINWIVNGSFTLPSSLIAQLEIFHNQLSKFIKPHRTVSVVSGFPAFILDYYGVSTTLSNLKKD